MGQIYGSCTWVPIFCTDILICFCDIRGLPGMMFAHSQGTWRRLLCQQPGTVLQRARKRPWQNRTCLSLGLLYVLKAFWQSDFPFSNRAQIIQLQLDCSVRGQCETNTQKTFLLSSIHHACQMCVKYMPSCVDKPKEQLWFLKTEIASVVCCLKGRQ